MLKKKIKLESAASRNDGTISYGNESAVSQREREKERSIKGPAVIECHSHGPMLLATVLTRSLIASGDISFCAESQREAAGTPDGAQPPRITEAAWGPSRQLHSSVG